MKERGVDLDGALDRLAKYNNEVLSKFQAQRHMLPSWDPDTDRAVNEYVERLAYWIRGHDSWSFESRRYIGTKGPEIMKHRLVTMLPRVTRQPGVTPMVAPSMAHQSASTYYISKLGLRSRPLYRDTNPAMEAIAAIVAIVGVYGIYTSRAA